MITEVTRPKAISMVKNEVKYLLQTNQYKTSNGTLAQFPINISGKASNGDSFSLEFNGITVTLTAAPIPDSSGNQFHDNNYAGSTVDYTTRLVADFQKNYYIDKYYKVFYLNFGAPSVVFVARNPGTQYNITLTESLSWMVEGTSGNNPGVDNAFNVNFKILGILEVADTLFSSQFTRVLELGQTPDADQQRTSFYLQEILKSYLSVDIPTYGQTAMAICDQSVARFRFYFAEQWGNPVVPQQIAESGAGVRFVFNGGFSFNQFKDQDSLVSFITANQKFLTWQPNQKTTAAATHEYLYYLHLDTSFSSVRLYAQFTYTDGTTSAPVQISTIGALVQYYMVQIPVGYNTVQGFANPLKTLLKYDVFLQNPSGTKITETRTFVVDHNTYHDDTFLLYQNSFGGLETWRCAAPITKGISINKETFEQAHDLSYDKTHHFNRSFGATFKERISISTGYLNRAEIAALQDLLLSEYTYINLNGEYTPVVIDTNSIQYYKTREYLVAVRLDLMVAKTNKAYS